jgi:hypothetical protein
VPYGVESSPWPRHREGVAEPIAFCSAANEPQRLTRAQGERGSGQRRGKPGAAKRGPHGESPRVEIWGAASVRGRFVFDALLGPLSAAPKSFPVVGKSIDSIYAEPPVGRAVQDDGAPAIPPGVVF